MPGILSFLIGWPAIGLAVVAAGFGLARRRPFLLAGAGVLTLPISLYLAATPRFPVYPLLVPVFLAASAATVVRSPRVAAGLALPFAAFAGYLLVAVLTQPGMH